MFTPNFVKVYYDQKWTAICKLIFKQPDTYDEPPVSLVAMTSSHPLPSHSSMTNVKPISPWSLLGSPRPTHDEFPIPVPNILTGPTIDLVTFAIGTGVAYCDDILLLNGQQEPVATWSNGMWAPFCTSQGCPHGDEGSSGSSGPPSLCSITDSTPIPVPLSTTNASDPQCRTSARPGAGTAGPAPEG